VGEIQPPQELGASGKPDRAAGLRPQPQAASQSSIPSALRQAIETALGIRFGLLEAEAIVAELAKRRLAITGANAPLEPMVLFRGTGDEWTRDVIAQVEFKPGVYYVIHRTPAEHERDPRYLSEYLPRLLASQLVRHQESEIAAQIAQGIEAATAGETACGLDTKCESPVAESHAPNPASNLQTKTGVGND
jgi:hypothetical protein